MSNRIVYFVQLLKQSNIIEKIRGFPYLHRYRFFSLSLFNRIIFDFNTLSHLIFVIFTYFKQGLSPPKILRVKKVVNYHLPSVMGAIIMQCDDTENDFFYDKCW